MRADLYTIALISALPEDHAFLSNTHAPTFMVNGDQEYAVYSVFTEGVPEYDRSSLDENGDSVGPTDDELTLEIAETLRAGAEMIVVQRDLISAVRNELDPPPPEPPVYQTMFSAREYLALFPLEVQRAIFGAAESNVDLRIMLQKTTAGPVSVKDPETIAGVGGLLAAGLIDQELHDSILQGKLVS